MAWYNGDVKAANTASNTAVIEGPTRVKSLNYTATSSAGQIILKDGGSSGTALVTINVPASGYGDIAIPGDGIRFNSNVYTNLTNITSVTIFYG